MRFSFLLKSQNSFYKVNYKEKKLFYPKIGIKATITAINKGKRKIPMTIITQNNG